jgi:signal transduction histidine kinase
MTFGRVTSWPGCPYPDAVGKAARLWVASILYVAVLVAGLYYDFAGLCPDPRDPAMTVGFVGVLAFLLGLEFLEWRRFGSRTPRRLAVGLILLRIGLFEVVAAFDCSGLSRALYLLVPFAAYFSLGRRVSYGLAGLYLAAAVVRLSSIPDWYRDQESISDLLMFFIGMVFAVSMASVAAREEASRTRAEALLADLEVSHRRLGAYAEQAADLAAVTERNRLARDIHDSLGHHLTAIAVQLEKATAFRERDPAASEQALTDARRSATHALRDVRQSVGALRQGGPFSLSAALAELAAGLSDDRFAVVVEVDGDEKQFGGGTLMALYRAAQEGLTNARRHADADRVAITVALGPTGARLEIVDNGSGFYPVPSAHGHGLAGMRERLELIGGSLRVDSAPGRGTCLTLMVPRPPGTVADGPS